MCSEVMIIKPMVKAMMCRCVSENPDNGPSSSRAIAGSPIAPSASEASVIPSWQADKYALRFWSRFSSRFAARLPEAARVSMREERTPTRANSAATKKPLAATSNRTANSFTAIVMWGGNHSTERVQPQIAPINRDQAPIHIKSVKSVVKFYLVVQTASGGAGTGWPPMSTGECLIDARFDVALGLAANCGQL